MKNKEILNRVHDFLGKVVRDCPDQEMGLEASNLADDVWDVLHANEGLTFGQAIESMKQGKKVARKGWNGKGMYLWLLPATEVKKEWCRDPRLIEAMGERDALPCLGSIRMFTATKEVLTGWLASQTDMLSDDWVIVEENACTADGGCQGCI